MVNSEVTAAPWQDELFISLSSTEVRRASEWLAACAAQRGIPAREEQRLEICLNEVLANILAHGGSAAQAAPVRLQLETRIDGAAGSASLTVCDAGPAFNPLTVPPAPRPKTLADATAGGLGLAMIRRCADWLDYRRGDGVNQFVFGVRWGG